MPPRGYSNLTVKREAREALERVRETLGAATLSDALLELIRRVERFAPELLECREIEELERGGYKCIDGGTAGNG